MRNAKFGKSVGCVMIDGSKICSRAILYVPLCRGLKNNCYVHELLEAKYVPPFATITFNIHRNLQEVRSKECDSYIRLEVHKIY